MPYSGASDSNLPSNVKKLPADKKKKWVSVFNDTYNSCIDGGGTVSSCEGKAFKAANGSVKQGVNMGQHDRKLLRRVWESFLDTIGIPQDIERSVSFPRLNEKLWQALDDSYEEKGWAYPINMYIDNGDVFALVTQGGKLYQIPMQIQNENLTLGEWVQVEEDFKPVTQSRFFVRRQKDGTYRWTSIAGTTVLNRVGEIDSSELFDSFIQHAKQTGKYPRLDFYHLGETDPDLWEFGTADYLAREGVCYIASGTFDEDHPLAKATIKQCQESDAWGQSIEFYTYSEPEYLVMDPEVKVPVYKTGENIRISVVLEEDAAGLFTRMGVDEKVERSMDKNTLDALKKIFGDDEDAFNEFVENVDGINERVKNERLIHRAKQLVAENSTDEAEDDAKDEETFETEEDQDDSEEIADLILDEEGIKVLAQQVMESDHIQAPFNSVQQSIDELKGMIAGLVEKREEDSKEISRLKKSNKGLTEIVEALAKNEQLKQQQWAEDLPARRSLNISYRPRDIHNTDEDGADDEEDLTMDKVAERTLSGIARAY